MPLSPKIPTQARPGLLRRVNRERVVRSLQTHGPMSRSDMARHTGLGYATAVKICESLEADGFAESCEGQQQNGAGRPGNYLRMSTDKAQVIAIALGPVDVWATVMGLDGAEIGIELNVLPPDTYDALLDQIDDLVRQLDARSQAKTLGLGICVPGLIDSVNGKVMTSPNIHIIEKRDLRADLEKRTGLKTKLTGGMEAQFLVEQIRGQATECENFVVVNYRGGLGTAAACDSRRVGGARGMAGEIGHVVIDPGGIACGCGNRGCLETWATDIALTNRISIKLDRKISVYEMLEIHHETPELITEEVENFLDYLAIAVGMVVQAYNPSEVFLLGRFLENDDEAFTRLVKRLPNFCLEPLLKNCKIKRTLAAPLNGAGLAVIEELISQLPTKS